MTLKRFVPVALLLSGCAHLGPSPSDSYQRARLWDEAHGYLATQNYAQADSVFGLMAERYPETNEGRESLFYQGSLHLDPRNPGWDPEPAEERLQRYLAAETEEGTIHRRPEGEVLFQLAHQLNLPMEQRIGGLQDQTPPQQRIVIVPAEEAAGNQQELQRLRRDLATRENEVRQLREELERIQKTLTGGQ